MSRKETKPEREFKKHAIRRPQSLWLGERFNYFETLNLWNFGNYIFENESNLSLADSSSYSVYRMIRFLRLLAKILVLVIVALAAALISMRFAIHGREVAVPELRGMTPAEAERAVAERGLQLLRSDRFYSATVPAGRIVSQQPEPGTLVRRGWRVQAAESLGPQLSQIPSLVGMSPRAAEIDLRRRGLEPGDAAELPIDGFPPQSVLAQTPAPGAQGVAAPRVGLLYTAMPSEFAYAVPDLTGLPLTEAESIVNSAGLKPVVTGVPSAPVVAASSHPASTPGDGHAIGVAQEPSPGSRITRNSSVSLQVSNSI